MAWGYGVVAPSGTVATELDGLAEVGEMEITPFFPRGNNVFGLFNRSLLLGVELLQLANGLSRGLE